MSQSNDNWLNPMMKLYIAKAMTNNGKEIKCEKCGVLKGLEFHHEKYEGATIKDLTILCQKCHRNAKKPKSGGSELRTIFLKGKRYCEVNRFRFAY